MFLEEVRNIILKKSEEIIFKVFKRKPEGLRVDFPSDVRFGNLTLSCFSLAGQFHKTPKEIAQIIAKEFLPDEIIEEVKAVGPYLNFKLTNRVIFSDFISEVIGKAENLGSSKEGRGQRVMVEYLSPNTNKPLHLGHIRNGVFGMAVSNLLELAGFKVVKSNLINDRGIPICKSMLAWQKWAHGATSESTGIKGDHFVGKWYIRYHQESEKNSKIKEQLEREVQETLQKWEASDPETIKLWKMMNEWVYKGFEQTYQKLGLQFDTFYYESKTYKLGKDIVQEGLRKGVFERTKEGAVVFPLPVEEFGLSSEGEPKKSLLLREDGTTVYMTQDVATAKLRFEEYNLDKLFYVVGQEQSYHFRCLFRILEALGYKWAKNCQHLPYGMVYLPEGKMKSREGKVVYADDLIERMEKMAIEEIRKRDPENVLSEEEIKTRASKIGLAAINFYLLRVEPQQNIHFDPEESISFNGFTGPYCQYSYARARSILRKVEESGLKKDASADFSLLGNLEELSLVQKLIQFPDQVRIATQEFNLSRVASHIYDTAKVFNQFYQKHPVIGAENKELAMARLLLVQATTIALKKGLDLLGIEAPEKM